MISHEHLLSIVKRLPLGYQPLGADDRGRDEDDWPGDCSSGCIHYAIPGGSLGTNWGIRTNPRRHRWGLLTFEHQSCREFDDGHGDETP